MAQINKPTDYFNTITYTGNDVDGRTITGVGFQPDFTWIKSRSNALSHYLIDLIRYDSGASKYLKLDSSYNGADETPSAAGWVSELNSDGYVCKNGTSNTHNCNENGVTYVAWNWLAGGTASSNTDGSITSSVSASTTSGFSIVSYTGNNTAGATVGHGLGAEPDLIIIKNRDSAVNWQTYHKVLGNQAYMRLNTTDAVSTGASIWNNTSPTSSVFTLGSGFNAVNESGSDHIAYCFANKKGFSKFGSYVGNGGNQFIYTGFKPALVIEKRSSNSSEWDIYDNKRNTFNSVTKALKPNASDAEATYGGLNFLSNGFEAKGTLNDSGQTLIYMAFAEQPLVGTNNIPATAR